MRSIDGIAKSGGLTVVQTQMDIAAWVVGLLPPEQRAGWVIYFFEGLDSDMRKAEFNDLVGDVVTALAERLRLGVWFID